MMIAPGERSADELSWLSALELQAAYRSRELTPLEVVDALVAKAEALNPSLNALTARAFERARSEALESERLLRTGSSRPLEGIPFLAKDMFDTEGLETAYGSPIFAGQVPHHDAEAVRRARDAGAILIAKTSTDEFAYGITSCNPHLGAVHNPWALDRVSGGSSGGSAAAIACGLAPLALGSDTGGSIRAPAALCGVVGLKPTYDRIPRSGLFPMARTLDHVGPMARHPADASLFLETLGDPHSSLAPPAPTRLRVGICPDLHLVALALDVANVFDSVVTTLSECGVEVVGLEFPDAPSLFPTFLATQRAETTFTHRQAGLYPQRRSEYGPDVRARLDSAAAVTLDEYLSAQGERQRLSARFDRLFEAADVVLTPVQSATPVRIDEPEVEEAMRGVVMDYTVPHDLLGVPACTVRAGFDDDGVPVGVQVAARIGADETALGAAGLLFEATRAIQSRRPPLAVPAGSR